MRFKNWLIEGFGVDYANLPDTFRPDNFDAASISKKVNRGKLVDQLAQSNSMKFSPEDHPEDFIKVEKINSLQTLNLGNEQLPSFRSEILYGMKFTVAGELLTAGFAEKIEELDKQLIELKKNRAKVSNNGNEATRKVAIDTWHDILGKGALGTDAQTKMVRMLDSRLEAAGLPPRDFNWNQINKIINTMQRPPEENKYQLTKQINELTAQLKEMNSKKAVKLYWCNIIQQAFSRKIKHPQTPEDEQLSDHFVRLATDNYVKFRSGYKYDYVLYPESSSELNTKIAKSLGAAYGCPAVRGFDKVANPTIDRNSFIQNNPHKPPEWHQEQLADIQKDIDKSQGQIKNMRYNQSYIRNMQMNPTLNQNLQPQHELSGLTNRRLLVIDENTQSGGTLQIINHILWDKRPKSVHYYAPLYVNFSHGGKISPNLVDAKPKITTRQPVQKPPKPVKPPQYTAMPSRTYSAPQPIKPPPQQFNSVEDKLDSQFM